jgi:aspartate/methionine/tyrosine aminotransferase
MKLEPFELERWDAKWEREVTSDFGQSSGPTSYLNEITRLMSDGERRAFQELSLGYGHSTGEPRLRKAISSFHGTSHESVLVTCGATEGIALVFATLASSGGNVVVVDPCYQSLRSVPASLGLEVRYWTLEHDLTEPPSLEHLPRLLDGSTRAVVVNFPHNPTGVAVTDAWMRRLVDLAEAHDVYVVSDEVYRPIVYDHAFARVPAVAFSHKCLSIGDMSKSFGMGGLRIGWIDCRDRGLLERICELRDYTSISPPVPSQFLAATVLDNAELFIREKIRVGARNQRRLLRALCRLPRFEGLFPAAGGFVVFPRIRGLNNTLELCSRLASEHSINVIPGRCFGREDRVRIHFGLEEKAAARSIDALQTALGRLLGEERTDEGDRGTINDP